MRYRAIKIKITLFPVAVFLLISILFIGTPKKTTDGLKRASSLQTITTSESGIERIDYVDGSGRITFAADAGYATVIIKETDAGKLEEYFDEEGNPVAKSNGQYALLREYDDNGNNYRTTYLGIDGKPIITGIGYTYIVRSFDDNGNIVREKYYGLDGAPVCTALYGYGKLNEYNNEGKISRITHVDENDNPMMVSAGYAIVTRNYYTTDDQNNGKVESEFYFYADNKPIALSFGQYGVHKEYDENGQEAALTYLDAEGNPLVTNKGYTTVKRTYYANNSVASEQYYDINGNPYALDEGQYGVKKENGQTTYLDEEGSPKFNIRNLFYNQSWVVIIAAVVVVLISSVGDRRWNVIFLTLYLISIVYFTLMFRESGDAKVNLELFWSYKKIFTDSGARADILKNTWLFIPLGAILYKLYPHKRILLVPVLLSLLIELTQYVTGKGLFELDDVVSNGLGGVIGFYASNLLNTFKINSVFSCAWNWFGEKVSLLVKRK